MRWSLGAPSAPPLRAHGQNLEAEALSGLGAFEAGWTVVS